MQRRAFIAAVVSAPISAAAAGVAPIVAWPGCDVAELVRRAERHGSSVYFPPGTYALCGPVHLQSTYVRLGA